MVLSNPSMFTIVVIIWLAYFTWFGNSCIQTSVLDTSLKWIEFHFMSSTEVQS